MTNQNDELLFLWIVGDTESSDSFFKVFVGWFLGAPGITKIIHEFKTSFKYVCKTCDNHRDLFYYTEIILNDELVCMNLPFLKWYIKSNVHARAWNALTVVMLCQIHLWSTVTFELSYSKALYWLVLKCVFWIWVWKTYICRRSSGTSNLILINVFLVAGLLGLTGRNRSSVTISFNVASHAAYSIT